MSSHAWIFTDCCSILDTIIQIISIISFHICISLQCPGIALKHQHEFTSGEIDKEMMIHVQSSELNTYFVFCVLVVSILPLSVIVHLDFGNVSTVWYFLFVCLFVCFFFINFCLYVSSCFNFAFMVILY